MKILILGGSGFLGRRISHALLSNDHQVKSLSRRQGCDISKMLSPEDWCAVLNDIDAVINAVGIITERGEQRFSVLHKDVPSALFDACKSCGVGRVVQISALGADETAFSRYHLSKRAADDYLRALDLDWFVLRPSLVYGLEGASTRMFSRIAAFPVIPVFGDGKQQIQPIHIDDVVAAVVNSITVNKACQSIDLVGPELMSFSNWLLRLRQSMGKSTAPILPLPFCLALSTAYLGQYIFPLFQPDNLRMLRAGSQADSQPLVDFLGRELSPCLPEVAYDLSHA